MIAQKKNKRINDFRRSKNSLACNQSIAGYGPYMTENASIHLAAAYGDIRELQELIKQYQSLNKNMNDLKTNDGIRPLHLAAENGHLGMAIFQTPIIKLLTLIHWLPNQLATTI